MEIADGSSADFINLPHERRTNLEIGEVSVASLDELVTLKKSHIWRKHNWDKHFYDYKTLKANGAKVIDSLFEKRVEETKLRVKFVERDFNVDNSKFFKSSVRRFVEHDLLHEAVKFGSRPMFEQLKDDLSKADVSYDKFVALSHIDKVRALQEEVMALALERYIIPSHMDGVDCAPGIACFKIMKEMCFNFLPMKFRFFAIDNFDEVVSTIPQGFEKKGLGLIKDL